MIKEDIFNKLRLFPWENIKSSFGDCKGVDEYLIGLSSDSSAIRDSSYGKLDNSIVLQGGLHEGAFYSIQFLINYLRLAEPIFANGIYDLLFEIANGSSSFQSYISYTNTNDFAFYPVDSNDQSESQHLPILCRCLIVKHIDLYLEEIKTNRNNSRKEALSLVASFDEFRGILIEPLTELKDILDDTDILKELGDILDEFNEEDGGIYKF